MLSASRRQALFRYSPQLLAGHGVQGFMVVEGQLTRVMSATTRTLDVDADAQLMLRFQAGEAECFDSLVLRHRKPLLHFIYRMVQDPGVSEELTQEAFLRVYLSRERYTVEARFTTWLYRIATHLTLNHIRDHRHEKRSESLDQPAPEGEPQRELPDRHPGAESGLLKEEKLARVRRAVAGLPERQRSAVLMHKYQGMDYREIGQALRLSESATKSLLFRAYETLRVELSSLL